MTVSAGLVEPAFCTFPPSVKTYGPEVADLCDLAGYSPDAEQRMALDLIFAQTALDKSAAFEAAVVACRQNIKTALFKMCVLGWLYITDQELIIWSAHEFSTTSEAHRDLAELIENCDPLRRRVKGILYGHGYQNIELLTGQRVEFKARTRTGGRGLSGDKTVLDEAFALQPAHMGALLPIMSARSVHGDPQVLYGSSAGLETSTVLRSIRDRGRLGDPGLLYIEYTDDLPGDCQEPSCDHKITRRGCRLDDEARWARANPALGRRISVEHVRKERRAMPPEEFARERLGWWDEDPNADGAFPEGVWGAARTDCELDAGAVSFAVEVAPDRDWAAIAACGTAEGSLLVDVVAYEPGTTWIGQRLTELTTAHPTMSVVVQKSSPAGSLIPDLLARNVNVVEVQTQEYAQSCGSFFDGVVAGDIKHLGQPELDVSVRGARKRPSSEAWAWDRRRSGLDISPLVAVTLAAWGQKAHPSTEVWGFYD